MAVCDRITHNMPVPVDDCHLESWRVGQSFRNPADLSNFCRGSDNFQMFGLFLVPLANCARTESPCLLRSPPLSNFLFDKRARRPSLLRCSPIHVLSGHETTSFVYQSFMVKTVFFSFRCLFYLVVTRTCLTGYSCVGHFRQERTKTQKWESK